MATNKKLLTAAEVADLIQVSPAWVQEQARRGEIPAIKLGRWWRFERDAIEAWLRSHQSSTYKHGMNPMDRRS